MTAIYIITHPNIGEVLLTNCQKIIGEITIPTKIISVDPKDNIEIAKNKAAITLKEIENIGPLLILTDIPGASPSNLAFSLKPKCHYAVITGINLAMLVSIYNYPKMQLDFLVKKAIDNGKKAITATIKNETKVLI